MIYRSKSIGKTSKIASDLAQKIINSKPGRQATVVALEGELGAGKTTFVKGFARSLGVKTHITSPTFVILKNYRLKTIGYRLLYHMDAYRLKNYKDLLTLDAKGILADSKNIVLIEWSDRVEELIPPRCIKIHIDHISKNTRKISIKT